MRTKLLLTLAAVVCWLSRDANAVLLSYNFTVNAPIPDGNTVGYFNTQSISAPNYTINDLVVRLEITGGYNGDLYVYLQHSSGFSVLMNRVGRTGTDSAGYGDAGLNVTFSDSGAHDIHRYGEHGGVNVESIWQPDARNANPLTVTDQTTRSAYLSSFDGLSADGTWTLFVADLSGGDQGTLVGWGFDVDVTPVPEPVNVALGIFGVAMLAAFVRRKLRR